MFGLPKVFFLITIFANCLIWSQSRYAQLKRPGAHLTSTGGLVTRAFFDVQPLGSNVSLAEKHCNPISFPPQDQCSLVQDRCSTSETFLSIPYLQDYFCTIPKFRPLAFATLLIWAIFLFSTLGISASDFFCPNLHTLSLILGLDENVAGVTFLAFGNGSPDVFSTFSAMRAQSGGLAMGELLGAAAFVTSCVVGSMCIIKPFRVERGPFLRDVGFFTFAVILVLVVLWDSKLEEWEAAGLVILYLIYVTVVVVGSYLERRRERIRRQNSLMRDEFREDVVPYHDDPSDNSHYHHHTFPRYGGNGGTRSRTPSLTFLEGRDREAYDASLGLPLDDRSPPQIPEQPLLELDLPPPQIPLISVTPEGRPASLVDTETETETELSQSTYSQHYSSGKRIWRRLGKIFHILFPTLHDFKSKSFLGKIAALFAAPAVMALTLTLPVVITSYDGPSEAEEKLLNVNSSAASIHGDGNGYGVGSVDASGDGRLVDFEEEGVERTLVAEEEVEHELHELKFNKWLMAVQCVLGPVFCIAVLFDGVQNEPWLLLAAAVTGLTCAIIVAVFAHHGDSVAARLVRCSMGFMVAMVWIMAIADEVVEVLTTFGTIFGLSDAIIGITIFAMGNSLADLVANMSVAVFAPIMGFSACFGGPMLNILLGIGISGTYVIRQNNGAPYLLPFSTTLVITSTGLLVLLLATLLFVPWNGYYLTRTWGVVLIAAYTALMIANVVVEITTVSS